MAATGRTPSPQFASSSSAVPFFVPHMFRSSKCRGGTNAARREDRAPDENFFFLPSGFHGRWPYTSAIFFVCPSFPSPVRLAPVQLTILFYHFTNLSQLYSCYFFLLNSYMIVFMTKLGSLIRSKRKALGLTQAALGDLAGVSQSAVTEWERGKSYQIRDWKRLADALMIDEHIIVEAMAEAAQEENPQRMSAVVKEHITTSAKPTSEELLKIWKQHVGGVNGPLKITSYAELMAFINQFRTEDTPEVASSVKVINSTPAGARDVPVFGKAQGGDGGVFEFNGEVLGWEIRPPMLEGVSSAYAVYVDGDSMYPRYKPGETVWVNPNKVPARGDDVIVQLHPIEDGDPPRGFVKEFVSWKANQLVLTQHNPTRDVTFERWQVKSVHPIVFSQR